MKIKYINEAFKKISDLKKDVDIPTRNIREDVLLNLIQPILINEDLLVAYIDYVKYFICTNVMINIIDPITKTQIGNPNDYIRIVYNGVKNDVIHLSIKFLDVNTYIYIQDINFRNNIIEDIKNELNYNCTSKLFAIWKKEIPDIDIKNIINSVYIDNIVLIPKTDNKILLVFNSMNFAMDNMSLNPNSKFMINFNKAIDRFKKVLDSFILSPSSFIYKIPVCIAKQTNLNTETYKKIMNSIHNYVNNDDSDIAILNRNYINRKDVNIYGQEFNEIFLDIRKYSNSKNFNESIIEISKNNYHTTLLDMIAISSSSIENKSSEILTKIFNRSCKIREYGDKGFGGSYIKSLSKAIADIEYYTVINPIYDGDKIVIYTFNYGKYLGKLCFTNSTI